MSLRECHLNAFGQVRDQRQYAGGAQHLIGQPDGGRSGTAEIVNTHIADQMGGGVRLTWDASALPSLVRWQLANVAGHYVLGLEPCTGRAEPTSNELSFPTLQPGEARRLGVTIELLKFPSEPLARPLTPRVRTARSRVVGRGSRARAKVLGE